MKEDMDEIEHNVEIEVQEVHNKIKDTALINIS